MLRHVLHLPLKHHSPHLFTRHDHGNVTTQRFPALGLCLGRDESFGSCLYLSSTPPCTPTSYPPLPPLPLVRPYPTTAALLLLASTW